MSFAIHPTLTYESTVFKSQSDGQTRNWYYEHVRGQDSLLIAAGDSWTWGDSLHSIDLDANKLDDPKRVTSIYGSLLAKKLNADFVNLAKCGGANIEFHDYIADILPHAVDRYKQIYVVLTLTENCRESYWDKIWVPDQVTSSLDQFLELYERAMFESLLTLISKYPRIKFLIARNFTYSFDSNREYLGSYHCDKTWVDCLEENQDSSNRYPDTTKFVTSMAYVPLQKLLKELDLYKKFKFEFMPYYADSEMAIDWLEASTLNYKKATKHPTEQGHQIWADYLYSQLTKN